MKKYVRTEVRTKAGMFKKAEFNEAGDATLLEALHWFWQQSNSLLMLADSAAESPGALIDNGIGSSLQMWIAGYNGVMDAAERESGRGNDPRVPIVNRLRAALMACCWPIIERPATVRFTDAGVRERLRQGLGDVERFMAELAVAENAEIPFIPSQRKRGQVDQRFLWPDGNKDFDGWIRPPGVAKTIIMACLKKHKMGKDGRTIQVMLSPSRLRYFTPRRWTVLYNDPMISAEAQAELGRLDKPAPKKSRAFKR
jgi:hypothetical protein